MFERPLFDFRIISIHAHSDNEKRYEMEHVIQFKQTWHKVKKIDCHTDAYHTPRHPFVLQPFSKRDYH